MPSATVVFTQTALPEDSSHESAVQSSRSSQSGASGLAGSQGERPGHVTSTTLVLSQSRSPSVVTAVQVAVAPGVPPRAGGRQVMKKPPTPGRPGKVGGCWPRVPSVSPVKVQEASGTPSPWQSRRVSASQVIVVETPGSGPGVQVRPVRPFGTQVCGSQPWPQVLSPSRKRTWQPVPARGGFGRGRTCCSAGALSRQFRMNRSGRSYRR